ncbi:M23 family metallopeptidase [Nocardia flavorosea]|uniref:M23 family metallopeptidase n=1 Tax=Nocardia flavorosea TaxID=53429 RepID=A0A846YDM9_9NOCA|nr:M23 family metallopeptidase [Nocardia flavorosea]
MPTAGNPTASGTGPPKYSPGSTDHGPAALLSAHTGSTTATSAAAEPGIVPVTLESAAVPTVVPARPAPAGPPTRTYPAESPIETRTTGAPARPRPSGPHTGTPPAGICAEYPEEGAPASSAEPEAAAGTATSPAGPGIGFDAPVPANRDDGHPPVAPGRRTPLRHAVVLGGGRLIAPDWRKRAAQAREARPAFRQRSAAAYRWTRRQLTALRYRVPTRAEIAELLDRRPSAQEIADSARRHRFLLGGLGLTLLLAAGDAGAGLLVSEQPPAPGIAHRVAVAHPLQLSTPVPSIRRYLDAIDNGERLREQAVVAAAARATLQRAKAEAAAAAAGQEQPWINSAPGAPEGALPPGAVLPGPGGFVLPAPGTFTSGFGSRWGTFHRGIDIAGPIGTPIYAVADGTVIDAGPAQGFGLWVRIRHNDGTISVYGHMYDFFVSVGERVPAGMQIARMGNRGDSSGPHLHFEIIMDGRHVDPQRWLALHGLSYG